MPPASLPEASGGREPAAPRALAATEWVDAAATLIKSITGADAAAWLQANHSTVARLIEWASRDPGVRALLRPDQITAEPGVDPATFPWDSAEVNGLDETVIAMQADLPATWERLQRDAAGLNAGTSPIALYRKLLSAVAAQLAYDPNGTQRAALPGLLAGVELAQATKDGEPPPAVLPSEVLAVVAHTTRGYVRRDTEREGLNPLAVAPADDQEWLAAAEAALWQTPTAATRPAEPPTLDATRSRLKRLRTELRSALLDDARAEAAEPGRPRRSRWPVPRPIALDDAHSASVPTPAHALAERAARDRLDRERVWWQGTARSVLTERDARLFGQVLDGERIADAASALGMTAAAGRKVMERARARVNGQARHRWEAGDRP